MLLHRLADDHLRPVLGGLVVVVEDLAVDGQVRLPPRPHVAAGHVAGGHVLVAGEVVTTQREVGDVAGAVDVDPHRKVLGHGEVVHGGEMPQLADVGRMHVIERLWGGPETLIVISTDLSHYHSYDEARAIDGATIARIASFATDIDHEEACGATPLNGLLFSSKKKNLSLKLLSACNSGDYFDPAYRYVHNRTYNGLIVGGADDQGTADRYMDAIYGASSYLNHSTPNGDRELPRFSPKNTLFASAPSTWMFVPDVRAPPTENWPPVPTSGCGLTSAERARKSTKSRPFTGRFSISVARTSGPRGFRGGAPRNPISCATGASASSTARRSSRCAVSGRKRPGDAQDACELLRSRPLAGAALYRLGEIHRIRGELEKAEAAYLQANERGRKPQPGLSLLRLAQGEIDAAAASIGGGRAVVVSATAEVSTVSFDPIVDTETWETGPTVELPATVVPPPAGQSDRMFAMPNVLIPAAAAGLPDPDEWSEYVLALDRGQSAAPGDHGVHNGLRHEAPEDAGQGSAVPFRFQLPPQGGARPPHDDGDQKSDYCEQDCLLDPATESAEPGIEHDRHDLLGRRVGRDLAPVPHALDHACRVPESGKPADRTCDAGPNHHGGREAERRHAEKAAGHPPEHAAGRSATQGVERERGEDVARCGQVGAPGRHLLEDLVEAGTVGVAHRPAARQLEADAGQALLEQQLLMLEQRLVGQDGDHPGDLVTDADLPGGEDQVADAAAAAGTVAVDGATPAALTGTVGPAAWQTTGVLVYQDGGTGAWPWTLKRLTLPATIANVDSSPAQLLAGGGNKWAAWEPVTGVRTNIAVGPFAGALLGDVSEDGDLLKIDTFANLSGLTAYSSAGVSVFADPSVVLLSTQVCVRDGMVSLRDALAASANAEDLRIALSQAGLASAY